MIAWHGEQSLKDAAMARIREHHRLDEIAQGVYWQDGRGCHLGCITHDNRDSHSAIQRMFGIELRVAFWLEAIFEGLSSDLAPQWVIDSTEAIPVGADLSKCHHHLWLRIANSGLLTIRDADRQAIDAVTEYHSAAIAGNASEEMRSSAASAAWAAAMARYAESARSAAESASPTVVSASCALDWAAMWSWSWQEMADASISIFAAAPVVAGEVMPDSARQELCSKKLWCPEGVTL